MLINGAGGGVGTFAVQIAKSLGADVTAVCSTRNLDLARSIGADRVVDYTREDFTQSGKRYDLILAVNGYYPISAYKRALSPHGVYVMVGGTNAHVVLGVAAHPAATADAATTAGYAQPHATKLFCLAAPEGGLSLWISVADQFGIRSGTIVTIPGKNHRIARPSTWISTNGITPR